MHWFPLSLICAISLAAADALTKKFLPDYKGWELVVIRLGVPALLLLPVAILNPIPAVPAEFIGWMALLIPLELIAMLLYMLAIRDSPLYLTLPYLAFTPVFNVLTGYLVLGESVSVNGLAGIALIFAGSYMLNIRDITRDSWYFPFLAILHERGSRLMLGAAAIYSFTSVLGKHTMQYATPATFGPFYYAVLGTVLLLLTAIIKPSSLKVLARRPGKHLVIGLLMAIMVTTHFLAIAKVEVAYMIAVKRSSLLFGIIFGALLFNESYLLRHFAAGILIVTGVGMIVI